MFYLIFFSNRVLQTWDDAVCGVQYSKVKQAGFCAVDNPPVYPAFLQVGRLFELLPGLWEMLNIFIDIN